MISVVIVTFNSAQEIGDCLASLRADLGDRPVEIVVVDNASADGTVDYLRTHWSQVRLIAQRTNRGFAAGCNVGLAHTTGDPILLLNPDTIAQPGFFDALLRALDARPRAGLAGPRLLNADGSLQPSCREFPSLLGDFIGMSELYRSTVVRAILGSRFASLSDHYRARPVDWLSGACLLIRREALEAVGGLDEDFFMYSEEMEWQHRLQKLGWQIWFEPAALLIHLGGASTASVPGERIVWQYQGMFRFYRRHRATTARAGLRLLVWLVTLPKLVLLLGRGITPRRRVLFRAFWQVLWLR